MWYAEREGMSGVMSELAWYGCLSGAMGREGYCAILISVVSVWKKYLSALGN